MALKYQIALCSVWWKKGDIDCRLFTSLQEQIEYFANKIDHWSDLVNFPINDNDATTITFRDTSNKSIYEIVESNYAVIKKTDGDNVTYRYYFAKLFQDSGRQFVVDLNLDDFQTNYLMVRGTSLPALIRRATISRYKADKTFDFSSNSKMHLKESVKHSQRLVKRERINIQYTEHADLNEWLCKNVAGWHYYFCDSSQNYKAGKYPFPSSPTDSGDIKASLEIRYNNNYYIAPYGVFVAPLYIGPKKIIIHSPDYTNSPYILSEEGLSEFIKGNLAETSGKIYGSKFSAVPPFTFGFLTDYYFDEYDNLVINVLNAGTDSNVIQYCCYGTDYETPRELYLKKAGVILPNMSVSHSYANGNITCINALITQVQFKKDSLDFEIDLSDYINLAPNPKGYSRNKIFNPKMLQSDYMSLRLVNENNSFDYYFDLLDGNKFNGKYRENILIGPNKSYGTISSGLYDEETMNNFTGVVSTYDTSIPLLQDKWDEFIANNKNFFLQAGFSYVTSLYGATINFAMGNMVSTGRWGLDALSKSNKMADAIFSKDNMENAPQSLSNASGDPFFIVQTHPLGLYYEIYECLDIDKDIDNDYEYFNGYEVGTYGRLYEYDHNRKYFDYVQAEIDVLNLDISNDEKQRITSLLRGGLRMWHEDNFAGYLSENYELIFDEE